ncbi:energy-coupling factor transporter transmembrane protein EcfT [Rhizobium sp. AQ_MP]|uniref:energy-coupling factor transporter transmembrane component T family protein n=1 Tax=Rhizobium sp. AQ_MP TaxID=2761536 RepID=UPI001639F453|nr:energy-coupling factor transporter transmembrane protein EcfT [Rhizobium sp. AQ_MP]MBC2772930.1 energy-coupling factor transporter transmembrane protein EcfT [Rhizobium sp. AQ_MP]
MLTSLHVEGTSLLHRIPVKPKLFGLMVFGLLLYLIDQPVMLGAALIMTALVYRATGIGLAEGFRRLKPVLFTIAFLAAVNLLLLTPLEALVTTLRLVAILFLAAAVTASTTVADFMAAVTDLARPLERLGLLKAADLGLAFGLVLRFVPEIAARYEALKEAHAARGIPVKLSRLLGPLIISTLKDADRIAEAIDARGIRGQ